MIKKRPFITAKNPFNVTFDKEPNEAISRKTEQEDIYKSLSPGLSSDETFIISGVWDSGKTVTMTLISDC